MLRSILRVLPPLLLGLAVGGVGLEILARVAWEDAWRDPAKETNPEGLPVLSDDVFVLARPNARGLNRGVPYRSNSRGFRGPEYGPEPAPGTFRIVVTGDSTTMGAGVREEDRYSDQLERMLNAEASDRRYEIVNVGLSGQNAAQDASRLEMALDGYRTQMIVYGFSPNDIEGPDFESRTGGLAPPDQARRRWALIAEYDTSPSYFWRFLGAWRIAHATSGDDRAQEFVYNFTHNDAAWSHFLEGLDHFARIGREHGVCAHVLIHPYFDDFDASHPLLEVYQRVEAAARERGLSVTQGFPYFEGRSPRTIWVSLFDSHPNREGHRILAQALHDGLKRLPASCWTIPPGD